MTDALRGPEEVRDAGDARADGVLVEVTEAEDNGRTVVRAVDPVPPHSVQVDRTLSCGGDDRVLVRTVGQLCRGVEPGVESGQPEVGGVLP